MRSLRTHLLLLIALFVLAFGLAAGLVNRLQIMLNRHGKTPDFLGALFGDTRYAMGDYFFRKADVYYHSGYYPSMFDNNRNFETAHMAADTGAITSKNQGENESFMGPPRDWLDAFERHFMPDRHTHLDEGGPEDDLSKSYEVDEILPWLKIATDLDPGDIRTYIVTSYWLRQRMNKVKAAEQVLREGLRNNPDSYDIMYELGRLYNENLRDPTRARYIWEAAVRKFNMLPPKKQDDERYSLDRIASQLAELERKQGHWQQAIDWFKISKTVSPTPDAVQHQIDEIKKQMAAHASTGAQ